MPQITVDTSVAARLAKQARPLVQINGRDYLVTRTRTTSDPRTMLLDCCNAPDMSWLENGACDPGNTPEIANTSGTNCPTFSPGGKSGTK
ncbi:hypothetical protein [Maricaulis sp.]|uniref:hypothetical protein n=1 Tax=Maricaulis sp. TaxID=1486257 RepID=UPI003A91B29F